MAITKTEYVERVVIVFRTDGTLKGAHQSGLEIIADNGATISERETAPVPVDAATLAQLLPDVATLTAQVSALVVERDELTAQVSTLTTERDGLAAQLAATAGVTGPPPGIAKLTLIDRLAAAGLFPAALAALQSDPLQYERWQALTEIDPQNEEIRSLLTAIGGDLDALLAIG
jgi:hypothetical protein